MTTSHTGGAIAGSTISATQHEHWQDSARKHLWMHFTRMGSFAEREVPVMVRGEGVNVFDSRGKRYLDALSGLFVTQVGHGRHSLAQAAASQAETLGFFPVWGYAHPAAIELAEQIAHRAPGELNRVFFTGGGSEAVESAWKLAKQYFAVIGQPQRHKVISRDRSYHGVTMGALAITGVEPMKAVFGPQVPGTAKVPWVNTFRAGEQEGVPFGADGQAYGKHSADLIEAAILAEGPETVAAVFLEPVQNAGGSLPPPEGYFQAVREVCDRHGVLLVSDEVICAFGRLGHTFGAQRYGYQPDMITFAKGVTSGYAPMGGVLVSDTIAEPFLHGKTSFNHGVTFGGHPVAAAVGLANLQLFDDEDLLAGVREREGALGSTLGKLMDLPIVGDVRGAGFFWSVELVKDKATAARFDAEERERLLRGFLSPALHEAGLIVRPDDRGDTVVTLAPPLICGQAEFDEMEQVLRAVLTQAQAII